MPLKKLKYCKPLGTDVIEVKCCSHIWRKQKLQQPWEKSVIVIFMTLKQH
jgi:hypothetical protein